LTRLWRLTESRWVPRARTNAMSWASTALSSRYSCSTASFTSTFCPRPPRATAASDPRHSQPMLVAIHHHRQHHLISGLRLPLACSKTGRGRCLPLSVLNRVKSRPPKPTSHLPTLMLLRACKPCFPTQILLLFCRPWVSAAPVVTSPLPTPQVGWMTCFSG